MAGVAVFVDYENLIFILQRREYSRLHHQKIGEALLKYARQFGEIQQAVMWAEWDRFHPNKRQEQSAQALLTEQGFDCLYLLRPSDRSYTEQAIIKKLSNGGKDLEHVILVSGDYVFPDLLTQLRTKATLILVSKSGVSVPGKGRVQLMELKELPESEDFFATVKTPHDMDETAFFIWMQKVLQEELNRRAWQGMSFHMLARLLVERNLCEEDLEAQFYINQAVREGFLERMERELPTGRRILLKPTTVDRGDSFAWQNDEEFRWVQLIWALEMILARNPWWEYVTFTRLREELEKCSLSVVGDDLQKLVAQAVEKGIYRLIIEESEPPLFRKKYKYTFGDAHKLRKKVYEIPLLILRTMRFLLEENPHWHGVSFSKLLDELVEHPQITAGDEWIERQRLKEWCNFLVSIGFLHAFKGRPRVVEGELRDPPTLLRIVPEHQWVQYLNAQEVKETQPNLEDHDEEGGLEQKFALKPLDYYRLVVVIEHYLHISNNDAVVAGWMPMSTLFHVMGRSLDRAFCNAVVRSAREKGIIEIRTHDPRPGQHPARGAHPDLDHPISLEARKRLLRLLDLIQHLQDRNGIVELEMLQEKLREDPFFGETEEERLGWIDLMREENLILIRLMTSNNEELRYQCTLNFRDRYVLTLLDLLESMDEESFPKSDEKDPSLF